MDLLSNSFNLHQVVAEPTRFSGNGKESLLDLILVTDYSLLQSSFVLPCVGNSDHNAVGCVLKYKNNVHAFKRVRKVYWCTSLADIDKASSLIDNVDWVDIMNLDNMDDVWNAWRTKFMDIMTECVPRKSILICPSLPWINASLIRKIRKRNKYYKRSSKCVNNDYYLVKYREMKLKHLLK